MSPLLLIGLFLVFVIAPIIFWFWFFLSKDRAEPEPRRLLFIIFLLGLGVFLFSFAAEATIFSFIFPDQFNTITTQGIIKGTSTFSIQIALIFILAGVIEEIIKYFTLYAFLYHKTEWNQIADGVFYGITLALGFALIENASYFYELASAGTAIFISAIMVRAVATIMLHVTTTGILGYAFGKKKFNNEHKRTIVAEALFVTIFLHSLFNVLILLPYGMLVAFPVLFITFLYLLKLLQRGETKLIWKLVTPKKHT